MGDSCVRDWVFHVRSLYGAMREKVSTIPEGNAILEKTMREFAVLYGDEARRLTENIEGMNFYEIGQEGP